MSEVDRQRKNLLFSGHGCRRLADNGKINHGKGVSSAAALTFPFQNIEIGKMDIGMEKKVEKGYPKQSCESGKKGLCHIF